MGGAKSKKCSLNATPFPLLIPCPCLPSGTYDVPLSLGSFFLKEYTLMDDYCTVYMFVIVNMFVTFSVFQGRGHPHDPLVPRNPACLNTALAIVNLKCLWPWSSWTYRWRHPWSDLRVTCESIFLLCCQCVLLTKRPLFFSAEWAQVNSYICSRFCVFFPELLLFYLI